MTKPTAIIWFRQDLRLKDNPALLHATQNNYKILPVFIHDDENAGPWKRGGASCWWLHKSLQALNKTLDGNLVFRSGKADEIIPQLIEDSGAAAIFWNRCYEPWRITRDKKIKENLSIESKSFNAAMLWEPWEVLKQDGTPYKVFTPYYRKGCTGADKPEPPAARPAPDKIDYADFHDRHDVEHLDLLPKIQWHRKMEQYWQPGEDGAQKRLAEFLDDGLQNYKEGRDHPAQENVSRLSPHLHFGEISPRDVWHEARLRMHAEGWEKDGDHFCSELGWREFSTYLLYHFPELPRMPLQEKFENFPWAEESAEDIERWQRGQTGIPIIDAGMRQLWETGWMHNRVRMIVASLLVKNMLQHWHIGEDWFWDCLVDADLANNSASWQWVAGCGADAAPYFRVFNPVTQGKRFDPDGEYVRKFVPELKDMDSKYIHEPWEAGLEKPRGYPDPIVDLKTSRERALAAWQEIK